MATKNELAKQVEGFRKQAENLRARRQELKNKLDSANDDIQQTEKSLSTAVLDGQDTSKLTDNLARARVERDGLSGAIDEASLRLADLEREITDTQNKLRYADFSEVFAEAEERTIRLIDRTRSDQAEAEEIAKIFERLEKILPIDSSGDDHARIIRTIFNSLYELLASVSNNESALNRLRHLEGNYPNQLQAARKKHK